MMPIIKALHRTENEGAFPDPFHEATIAPPPKEGGNNKEIEINFFSEHRCKTFQQNQILFYVKNEIWLHIKKIICHNQVGLISEM